MVRVVVLLLRVMKVMVLCPIVQHLLIANSTFQIDLEDQQCMLRDRSRVPCVQVLSLLPSTTTTTITILTHFMFDCRFLSP